MVSQKAGRAAKHAGSWGRLGSDSRIDSLRSPTRRHNKRQLTATREPAVTPDNRYSDAGSPRFGFIVGQGRCEVAATSPVCDDASTPSSGRDCENRHNPTDLHCVGRLSCQIVAVEASIMLRRPKSTLATVSESRYTSRFVLTPFFQEAAQCRPPNRVQRVPKRSPEPIF